MLLKIRQVSTTTYRATFAVRDSECARNRKHFFVCSERCFAKHFLCVRSAALPNISLCVRSAALPNISLCVRSAALPNISFCVSGVLLCQTILSTQNQQLCPILPIRLQKLEFHIPGVDSAPSENEYQEHFLGLKSTGAWG